MLLILDSVMIELCHHKKIMVMVIQLIRLRITLQGIDIIMVAQL